MVRAWKHIKKAYCRPVSLCYNMIYETDNSEVLKMTIQKIAKLAGVSPATVSRYLNHGYVSKEKRAAIAKVIDETGYTPSLSAQTLRSNKCNLIGVIVPKISSESISRVVSGIADALGESGYNIILANTDNDTGKELEFLQIFKNTTVDGVLFLATILSKEHHQLLAEYKKPIVVIGQQAEECSSVYHDDYGAACAAVSHLTERGCRKIGMLGVTRDDLSAGQAREDGYRAVLQKKGLPAENVTCAFQIESGREKMPELLKKMPDLDGVFCATDAIAFGAVSYLRKLNKKIPREIKIAAVGDAKMADVVSPSMTSVHLYYKTAGREAGRLILDMLASDCKILKQIKLGYTLMERESTGE